MASEDVIRTDICHQIDYLFEEIEEIVSTHQTNTKLIEHKIKELWEDFRDGLDYFLHQKKLSSQHLQKAYILHSESYFAERRVRYNDKGGYRIKLAPKTDFTEPPLRDILSTKTRLQYGRDHFHLAEALRAHWQSPTLELKTTEQIWGNLYLSLIYCSGCHDLQHLIAIGGHLLKHLRGTDIQISKLYHADYKKITNPLLLTYKIEHLYYGNEIENSVIYQWRQVWLNPYTIFLFETFAALDLVSPPQTPRYIIGAMYTVLLQLKQQLDIAEMLKGLEKLSRASDEKLATLGVINEFKYIHLGLELHPMLNLDMCLSQVLQQHLKAVSLSPTDQARNWFNNGLSNLASNQQKTVQPILPFLVENIAEFKTAHASLKEIPFELTLFEKSEQLKSTQHKRQRKQERIKWLRWSEIQKRLQQQKITAEGTQKNLIEAQLRLLAWIFELKNRGLKLSSIERYLSSIAKDYLFQIYLYEDDLEQMTEDDYELMYQNILHDLDQRDQVKRDSNIKKNQSRAHYAFGRLKEFHQFCTKAFKAPTVVSFKLNHFQRVQICHAKLISPQLWHQFKQKLLLQLDTATTLQDKRYLQQLLGMCILAYRLGLRLNEVRGLSLAEIISPELMWKDLAQQIRVKITLKNNSYRRLKSANAKRQLDLNLVLPQDELDYILCYLKQRLQQLSAKLTSEDTLVFAEYEQILSEKNITERIQMIWYEILGGNHGYTFHSFRHSAANHLAISWFGSKELIKTYTDYTWEQVKKMRLTLFGAAAVHNEALIQHKWRLLADWIGHGSIEQTASHYLHVLDLLAVDRIYQVPCYLSPVVLQSVVKTKTKSKNLDLKREIQRLPFRLYQQANKVLPFTNYTEVKLKKFEQSSSYQILDDYINRGLGESNQYNIRAVWLARKLQDPKATRSIWKDNNETLMEPDALFNLYNNAVKKKFVPQQFTDVKLDRGSENEKKALESLKVFINHAKVRKNFIHFQCQVDKNREAKVAFDIKNFKEGLSLFLPDDAVQVWSNYPINPNYKSREIKLSVTSNANKNITLAIVFGLVLWAIEYDTLWKIA